MIFLIKSDHASEEIDSTLDAAIERMCELLKEWPGAFKLTDEDGNTHASAFPGDPYVWAGDIFEHNGKTFGVACVRYFENSMKCSVCGWGINPKKLGCERCAIAKAPENLAGKQRKRGKIKDVLTENLPFDNKGADL